MHEYHHGPLLEGISKNAHNIFLKPKGRIGRTNKTFLKNVNLLNYIERLEKPHS